MIKKSKKNFIVIITAVLLVLLPVGIVCGIYIDNKSVEYEDILIEQSNRGQEIKIAHLSDLHFPKCKVDIPKMVEQLKSRNIDLIAITGDLIDMKANFEKCGVKEFIDVLSEVAPIYYVNGNHEVANGDSEKPYDFLAGKGVIVLKNESTVFMKGDLKISIIGLTDNTNFYYMDYLDAGKADYKMLLAHRPEWEKNITYSTCPNPDYRQWAIPDLVLTGHAHGGQFRINNRGLIAPNQGLFPEFDSGKYELTEHTSMIVSRGLGNSIIPFRFNNPPHIPIIRVLL